jgi:tetratricopeptide (TPR) repeat protein
MPRSSTTAFAFPPAHAPRRPRTIALCLLCALLLLAPGLHAQDFSHPDTPPNPQAALVQQANDAIAAGNFTAALKVLTTLNTQTPNNPQILYDLGLTLEALADPANPQPASTSPATPDPESCYRAAIAADPGFAAAHVALGLLLARTNHFAEAHAQLLAAVQLPDTNPTLQGRALRALARLDLTGSTKTGPDPASPASASSTSPAAAPGNQPSPLNPSAASDDLLAALKITPETPDDILFAAEIAQAAADLPGAEQAYRRYLAVASQASPPAGPQDVNQATAALAHVLLAQNHPAEAEAILIPALARNPGNPAFTAQLAESYLASGDSARIAKAVPLVESLHAANPGNASITRLLARVYIETGHPDQADPLYASLLAAQSTHPDPTLLDDRAEDLLLLHRPGEAEKLLKQAIANPTAFPSPAAFAGAATHLAFAASEIDDPRTTLQALALRATVQPPSPTELFLEATANDDLHQSSQAAGLYKQFLAAAKGTLPDQESQARQRLAVLEHTR